MESLEVRQTAISTLLTLDIFLALLLGAYLLYTVREESLRAIYSRMENQFALGLFIMLIGHSITRVWSAALLWRQMHGLSSWGLENAYPIALLGLSITIVGKACLARVLTRRWGEWGWIASMLLAGAVVTFTLYT